MKQFVSFPIPTCSTKNLWETRQQQQQHIFPKNLTSYFCWYNMTTKYKHSTLIDLTLHFISSHCSIMTVTVVSRYQCKISGKRICATEFQSNFGFKGFFGFSYFAFCSKKKKKSSHGLVQFSSYILHNFLVSFHFK